MGSNWTSASNNCLALGNQVQSTGPRKSLVDLADLAMDSADPSVIHTNIGFGVSTNDNRQCVQDESDFGAAVVEAKQSCFHGESGAGQAGGKWTVCSVARVWNRESGRMSLPLRLATKIQYFTPVPPTVNIPPASAGGAGASPAMASWGRKLGKSEEH